MKSRNKGVNVDIETVEYTRDAMHSEISLAFQLPCLTCTHNLCTIHKFCQIFHRTSCDHVVYVFPPAIIMSLRVLLSSKWQFSQHAEEHMDPPDTDRNTTSSGIFRTSSICFLEACFRPYRDRISKPDAPGSGAQPRGNRR